MRSTTVPPGTPCPVPRSGEPPLHRLEVTGPDAPPFAAGSFDEVGPLSRADHPHRHTFYEIVHVTAGSGTHVVDLARWPVRPPQLAVILPGQIHCWQDQRGLDGTLALFTEDFLIDHPGDHRLLRRLGGTCWFDLDAEDDLRTARLMADLASEHRQRAPGYETVLRALLHVLVIRTTRTAAAASNGGRRAAGVGGPEGVGGSLGIGGPVGAERITGPGREGVTRAAAAAGGTARPGWGAGSRWGAGAEGGAGPARGGGAEGSAGSGRGAVAERSGVPDGGGETERGAAAERVAGAERVARTMQVVEAEQVAGAEQAAGTEQVAEAGQVAGAVRAAGPGRVTESVRGAEPEPVVGRERAAGAAGSDPRGGPPRRCGSSPGADSARATGPGRGNNPAGEGGPERAAVLAEAFVRLTVRRETAAWTVRECAERLGVTPGHLTQAVRAATGRSPGRLLIEARVYQAQRLLAHTDLPVRQVAARVGINDPAYFCRFFRRETGTSPGDWRKHHSRHHQSIEAPGTRA
ncbi:helix-turn-helix domain-containing protein [Streptomyces sp. NPDC001037]|uniref:AraC family transcriptional regulator n=1 Tax=Streptomyces sp. NPDC001037 TaxID=3364542 RepID=UPI003688B3EF